MTIVHTYANLGSMEVAERQALLFSIYLGEKGYASEVVALDCGNGYRVIEGDKAVDFLTDNNR